MRALALAAGVLVGGVAGGYAGFGVALAVVSFDDWEALCGLVIGGAALGAVAGAEMAMRVAS